MSVENWDDLLERRTELCRFASQRQNELAEQVLAMLHPQHHSSIEKATMLATDEQQGDMTAKHPSSFRRPHRIGRDAVVVLKQQNMQMSIPHHRTTKPVPSPNTVVSSQDDFLRPALGRSFPLHEHSGDSTLQISNDRSNSVSKSHAAARRAMDVGAMLDGHPPTSFDDSLSFGETRYTKKSGSVQAAREGLPERIAKEPRKVLWASTSPHILSAPPMAVKAMTVEPTIVRPLGGDPKPSRAVAQSILSESHSEGPDTFVADDAYQSPEPPPRVSSLSRTTPATRRRRRWWSDSQNTISGVPRAEDAVQESRGRGSDGDDDKFGRVHTPADGASENRSKRSGLIRWLSRALAQDRKDSEFRGRKVRGSLWGTSWRTGS